MGIAQHTNRHNINCVTLSYLMAVELVLLLLLAVPLTAISANIYYVTPDDGAGHEQSCTTHQICHNLSHYISQSDHYFISDTIIIFLEGQHSFDRKDLVHVNNVHNLSLKGQGEWPVAGPEETVMQSTVIINCTRGRGGFIFDTGYDITIEGLTITNCGEIGNFNAVIFLSKVHDYVLKKNSLQNNTGCGIAAHDCENGIMTNCSYYNSLVCYRLGGGVYLYFNILFQFSNHAFELTYSNMTKCCSSGITLFSAYPVNIVFSDLVLSQNTGGGLKVTSGCIYLQVINCLFLNGNSAGGPMASGASFHIIGPSNITLRKHTLLKIALINSVMVKQVNCL